MLLEIPKRPLAARVANLGYRVSRRLGRDKAPLTPEDAKERAVAMCGLDDFGGDDFEEGLAVFCESANSEGRLDLVGREIMRAALRRILVNRLTLVEHRKHHDHAAPIHPPFLIIGLPRSGSTFLQRLLAEDPAAYAPPTWKMWHPLPIPGKADRRHDAVINAIESIRAMTPQLDAKHYLDADRTEECFHLRDPTFRGPGLYQLCPCPSYFEWQWNQDAGPSYAMYAEYLRIFQAEEPDRHLVLKAPTHTPHVDAILEHVPEVQLIQTHRDPTEVVGSVLSLAHTMLALTSPKIGPLDVRDNVIRLLAEGLQRNAAQRERLNPHIADVDYPDLVGDPIGTVRRIYETHGRQLSDEAEAAMRRRLENRPQNKYGVHRYDLADFDMTEDDVRAAFAR